MPFDANLILCDGSADWSYANLVTNNYGTPTSTTANAGGFVVLDIKGTAAKGMAAIFVSHEAGNAADDALTLKLQASDNEDFSEEVQTLALFEVDAVTEGIILGNECPCTVIRRFSTTKRYIRVDASCVADDDFGTCYVLLAQWPFNVM